MLVISPVVGQPFQLLELRLLQMKILIPAVDPQDSSPLRLRFSDHHTYCILSNIINSRFKKISPCFYLDHPLAHQQLHSDLLPEMDQVQTILVDHNVRNSLREARWSRTPSDIYLESATVTADLAKLPFSGRWIQTF